MLCHCSFNQDAVPRHPRCAAVFSQDLLYLQATGVPVNYNFNSTPVALQIHPCRSAPPPLSLCNSTPVALHLHPCRSATPPLSLSNPEGGPPLVFGMLHGHTSSSCILSTFAIRAATAADCKWLRWPWRSVTPQCFNLICDRKFRCS